MRPGAAATGGGFCSSNTAGQTVFEGRLQNLQAEQARLVERLEADRQERRRLARSGIFGPLIVTAEKFAPKDFEVPWGELFGATPNC